MNVDISGDDNPTDFSQGPWVTMLQDLDMDGMYNHNYSSSSLYSCITLVHTPNTVYFWLIDHIRRSMNRIFTMMIMSSIDEYSAPLLQFTIARAVKQVNISIYHTLNKT